MRKIRENILNTIFLIYNTVCIKLLRMKNGKFMIPKDYLVEYEDDFIELNEDVWFKRQYFGHINTSHYWQYCSEDCVDFTKDGLKLHQIYNPRVVDYWDGKTYNTTFDVGTLNSKNPFKHGIFEFDIVLPVGSGLWPAVWLTGFDSWPPEIDLMESYSDLDGNWNNDFLTNAFYGTENNVQDIKGRKSIPIRDTTQPINLKLVWEEDKIEYYYNNYKVRSITDKKILKWFVNQNMYVVLNAAVQKDMFDKIDIEQKSTFIVKKFTYYKRIIK